MVASRNQFNSLAREFGNAPNGSMPAFGAVGEMNARMNPTSWLKHREVTGLGEVSNSVPLGLYLGAAMIWFGLDMPGAKAAIDFTKDIIKKTKVNVV